MPAAATTQPCRVCTIASGPRRATTRTASSSIACSRSCLPVRSRGHVYQPALHLGDDLGGDDDDVAVGQPGGGGRDRRREVVAGPELGQARDRQDREPGGEAQTPAASRAARARSAVASGEDMSSGTRRTSTPGHLGVVVGRHQPGVEQPAGRAGAVVPADALGADLDAEHGQAAVGHPADDRAADDRRDAGDAGREVQQRLPQAGHAEDRADRRPPGSTAPAGRRRRRRRPR